MANQRAWKGNSRISKPQKEWHDGSSNLKYALVVTVALIVSLAAVFLLKDAITGSVINTGAEEYTDAVNLLFNGNRDPGSSIYIWKPVHNGNITSISLSGTLKGNGIARIYFIADGREYTILNSRRIRSEGTASSITAYDVLDGAAAPDSDAASSGADAEAPKTITAGLSFKEGTQWDSDDNGIEMPDGVVDFTVEETQFSWDADESKLCTRWEVYSEDSGSIVTSCNGGGDCCSFMGLASSADEWDAPFELYNTRYGATENNKVSAQVVYANYSLDSDNPYSDIVDSGWQSLEARFVNETTGQEAIEFNNLCLRTCLLRPLDQNEYILVAEVDNNTELSIDSITYGIEPSSESAAGQQTSIALKVENSRSEKIGAKINIYKDDVKIREIDDENETEIETGEYDIEIIPENSTVQSIILENVSVSQNTSEFLRIDDVPESEGFVKMYAIDPTPLNFTSGNVTATAAGNALMKCKDWNFSEQRCDGTWAKLMDIVPGDNYTFTLTPDDPGFGEIMITNALHLDQNYAVISNVYEQVRRKDIGYYSIV